MDAEGRAQLGALDHQLVHILGAAQTLADVGVVGMAGVVALIGVSLQQDRLAQAVGVQVDALDIVQRLHEGVGGLSAEVHADTHADRLGHFLAAGQLVRDVSEGDGAVLPVHRAVLVLVAGDDDFHQGVLGGLGDIHLVGHAGGVALVLGLEGAVPVEQRAAQAHHLVAAHFGGGGPDAGVGGAAGHSVGHNAAVMFGVALHRGAHAVGRHKGIHVVVLSVGQGLVHVLEGIAGLAGVVRHLAAGEGGVLLAAAHRHQAVVREVDGLHGMILLAVLLVVDDLGDLHGQHIAFHAQHHLDGGVHAGIVLHVQHIGGLAVLQGQLHILGRQLDVAAVDLDGVQGAGAAVEGLAVQLAALHVVLLDGGEIFIYGDRHLVGSDGLGGGGGQRKCQALHIAALHGHLLALAAVALQRGGGGVGAVHQVADGEGAVRAGHGGLAVDRHGGAGGGLAIGGHAAADSVALHLSLAFKVDILDEDIGGFAPPLGSLEGERTAAAAGQGGEIHRAAEGILAVDGDGGFGLGVVDAHLDLLAGGGSGNAAALVPSISGSVVGLPEPALLVTAHEQAVVDTVAAQIHAETGGGAAAVGFEGELQIALALVEADVGIGHIELVGAVVAGGGLHVQPAVLHR